ncbi:MAG: FmdB family zinc ribbon protein, partial [Candidatus Entotheonellia bacterium]
MPIFEYECQGCGHIFEKVQVVRQQEGVAACPVCQAS